MLQSSTRKPALEGSVLENTDRRAEVRVLDVRDQDAEGVGLLQAEVPGEPVRAIAELVGGFEHALTVGFPDLQGAVEDAGDRRR